MSRPALIAKTEFGVWAGASEMANRHTATDMTNRKLSLRIVSFLSMKLVAQARNQTATLRACKCARILSEIRKMKPVCIGTHASGVLFIVPSLYPAHGRARRRRAYR